TGGLMIYIDFSDTPRALIRQKTPEFVRYDQIDAPHVACEGPGARDPKVWRDIHWPYWTAQLKDYGLAPSSDMPVCVERFELIHPPSPAALFWAKARAARPDLKLGDRYRTRCIGGTRETNQLILGYIKSGEKVGTFPLPWQLQKTGEPMPKPGDFTIQLDIDGTPQLVVRTTSVAVKPFNDIDATDTAIDGPPVRPLEVWRRVHVPYYSQVLTGLGLAFSEDMPVCVERFELVYAP
ncbi:MAG: ASCH domain-containing protein, partial [Rhodospirillaceae bacterium]|nr:ASCH domain-containing protein [Rhodospirillaceae bacterium]